THDGIGHVLTGEETGVDLDDCRDPETGAIEPWAREIISDLDTYCEVSPSGTGVKLWLPGPLPDGWSDHRKPFATGEVEVYDRGRYFAVTGQRVEGTPTTVNERPEALRRLLAKVWPDGGKAGRRAAKSPTGGGAIGLDDDELLAKARAAANGDK